MILFWSSVAASVAAVVGCGYLIAATILVRRFARDRVCVSPTAAPGVTVLKPVPKENDWGYDRIVGALANLGYKVCDQTVGNVLQRHGLPPAPERKRTTTWSAFIRIHLALLAATDFFTAEVLTLRGLVTYYVLFFIHLESRRVVIAGITKQTAELGLAAFQISCQLCVTREFERCHPLWQTAASPAWLDRPVLTGRRLDRSKRRARESSAH
jgi:hypothetical protein